VYFAYRDKESCRCLCAFFVRRFNVCQIVEISFQF
jgi:hypothetical protein